MEAMAISRSSVAMFLAVAVSAPARATVIPEDRVPTANALPWNPGISGGIPSFTVKCATAECRALETGSYGNGTTDATNAIQTAIDSCPDNQYVHLPAGNYRAGAIRIWRSNVVLRGDGPDKTRIQEGGAGGIEIGAGVGDWPVPVSMSGASKGDTTITVANASGIAVGQLITVTLEDGNNPDLSGVVDDQWKWFTDTSSRSIGQTVEVAAKSGNVLTLSSPLYLDFPLAYNPAVLLCPNTVRNDGIESLGIEDGSGAIALVKASRCWVRNVESVNNGNGPHIDLLNSYRCVVRDSYIHESTSYTSGGDYGISLKTYTSDSLVENNIGVHMMFNVVFEASGGGNVAAYNYMDDSILDDDNGPTDWLMPGIGAHLLAPHMELMEGNWANDFCLDNVHGGTLFMTFFRNHSPGANTHLVRSENNYSAEIAANSYYTNLLGNVWWRSGIAGGYNDFSSQGPYQIGFWADENGPQRGSPLGHAAHDTKVDATLFRNGNFDYVTNSLRWGEDDANDSRFPAMSHSLPDSLYLAGKPAWWGNRPWPFVDPVNRPGAAMVGTLPAKACYDNRTSVSPAVCLAGSGEATLSVQPAETTEGDTGTGTMTFDVTRTD